MQVLSRKRDESIIITVPPNADFKKIAELLATGSRGDYVRAMELAKKERTPETIEVMVVGIRGDHTKLGSTAARYIRIDRKEIAEARAADEIKHQDCPV